MFDVISPFDVFIIDSVMSTATVPTTNYIVGPVNVGAHSRVFFLEDRLGIVYFITIKYPLMRGWFRYDESNTI